MGRVSGINVLDRNPLLDAMLQQGEYREMSQTKSIKPND
jgi:hypothetical protein